MDTAMMIVLAGIGFFLLTGLLGGIGIYKLFKNQRKQGVVFLSIGFACIVIFIVTLFYYKVW